MIVQVFMQAMFGGDICNDVGRLMAPIGRERDMNRGEEKWRDRRREEEREGRKEEKGMCALRAHLLMIAVVP